MSAASSTAPSGAQTGSGSCSLTRGKLHLSRVLTAGIAPAIFFACTAAMAGTIE